MNPSEGVAVTFEKPTVNYSLTNLLVKILPPLQN